MNETTDFLPVHGRVRVYVCASQDYDMMDTVDPRFHTFSQDLELKDARAKSNGLAAMPSTSAASPPTETAAVTGQVVRQMAHLS